MGSCWAACAHRQALPARLARGAGLLPRLDPMPLASLHTCSLAYLQSHLNLALLGVEAEDTLLHCKSTVQSTVEAWTP
nr:unnamed protein product [Digitaria exilis]